MLLPPLEWLTPALLTIFLSQLVVPTRAVGTPPPPAPVSAKPVLIYVGTYTSPDEKGIELLRLDPTTGTLTPLGLAAELPSPSFLCLTPDLKYLYAVSEAPHGSDHHGLVAGFAIEPGTGKLTPLNQQDSTGRDPCHLTLDPAGRHLLLANYGNGSIAVLPVDAAGRLGAPTAKIQHHDANTTKAANPHAHGVYFTGHLLLVPDLGLDQVLLYDYNPQQGTLTAATPAALTLSPGTGPRHLTFDPTGRHLYVLGELNSTIIGFTYEPARSGTPARFREIQSISLLPPDFVPPNKSSAAEIVVHPSGRFLFASNRGHDSIAVCTLDATTGRMTSAGHFPTHGRTPRHFMLDPTGTLLLVANQNSDNITVFRIDPVSGALTFTGVETRIHAPVCLLPLTGAE